MADEKKLPLPEKELPPPHDMLLNPESKTEGLLSPESKHEGLLNPDAKSTGDGGFAGKPPGNNGFSKIWEKYGSKKWLLPLLAFIGILILIVGISAVLDSQNGNRSRSEKRQDRREKKQERRENKRDRKQNKNQDNNNQKKKNNKREKEKMEKQARNQPVSFSYGSGGNAFSLYHPNDMKVDIGTELGGIYGQTNITVITFNGERRIKFSLVPNPNSLSLTAWHAQLAQQNKLYGGDFDTFAIGFNPEGTQAILQNAGNTWNVFVPLSTTILWANVQYENSDMAVARAELMGLFENFSIGSSSTLPSLPTNPTEAAAQ